MPRLSCGLWCVAAFLTALEATAACRPWVEVRTDRIRAISDRPQEEVLTIVDTLARFEDFVSRITMSGMFEPSRPTLVVMLSRTEWDRYMPLGSRIGGLFRTGPTENLILLPEPRLKPRRYTFPPPPPSLKADEPNPYSTILHEYVHFVMLDGTIRYPRWYSEGMAEVLGDVHFEDSQLRFGVMWAYQLEAARTARTVSFADLMERFPLHSETPKSGVMQEAYALAKTLVHYLSFSSPNRAKQLPQYLSLLNEGVADEAAFRAAFRTDYAGMQAELDEYLRRTTFPGGYMDWNTLSGATEAKIGTLACDDAMAEAGLALLSVGADRKSIRNGWFERARSEAPGSVPASIGFAYVADAEGDFAAADGILETIDSAATPLRWRNWAASIYMRLAVKASQEQGSDRDILLKKGLRWYPEDDYENEPEAAQAYYQSAYLHLGGDGDADSITRGVELAKKAVAIRPKDWVSAQMAAMFLQKLGEPEEALKYWQVVARFAQNPERRQEATRWIRQLAPATATSETR